MGSAGNFGVGEAAKAVFYNNAGQWLSAAMQFLFMVLIVSMLPVEEYGIYLIAFAILPFFGLLTFWGFPLISRYVPELAEKGNTRAIKKIVNSTLGFAFLASAACVLAFWIFPAALEPFFKGHGGAVLAVLFGVLFLLNSTTGVLIWALNALGFQKQRNFATVAYSALMLAFSFIAIKAGLGVLGVLAAIAAAMLLYLLMLGFFLQARLMGLEERGGQGIGLKKMARYTFLSYLGSFGELFLMLSVDIALLGIIQGPELTALYGFATKIPLLLFSYSPAVLGAAVLFPFIVSRFSKSSNKAVLSLFFESYSGFSAFFVAPMVFGAVVLGAPVISLVFSEKYAQTLPLFAFACVVMGLLSIRSALQNVYNAIEKPEIGIYSKVFFAFSTAAIILFARDVGIFWVFAFTAAAMVLMCASEFLMTARHVSLKIPWESIARTAVCTLAMCAFLLAFLQFITSVLWLALAVVAGALIYFCLALALKPFSKSDRELFEKAGFLGKLMAIFSRR